jgi:hypothetical protein
MSIFFYRRLLVFMVNYCNKDIIKTKKKFGEIFRLLLNKREIFNSPHLEA